MMTSMDRNSLTAILTALAVVPLYFKESSQPGPEKWDYRYVEFSATQRGASVYDSEEGHLINSGITDTAIDPQAEVSSDPEAWWFEVGVFKQRLWTQVTHGVDWNDAAKNPWDWDGVVTRETSRFFTADGYAGRLYCESVFKHWPKSLGERGWTVFQVDQSAGKETDSESKIIHLRRRYD